MQCLCSKLALTAPFVQFRDMMKNGVKFEQYILIGGFSLLLAAAASPKRLVSTCFGEFRV